MIVLGVTGGTGTGKSTVCKMLKDKGAKVIDADKIAKKAQRKGTPAYERIVEHFGKGILQENGEIDRAALGKIVFHDYREMLTLNHIVHEYVSKEIKEKVKTYREEGESLVVLDVPIPIEEGFFDTANSIWTVSANNDVRVERLMERMKISESEAEVRINAQMSNREYEEIADTVIQNEGSEEELKKLVDYEYMRLMAGL
ncbi:MAG: dephospho-CoA kinase [Clostridia bacterium]|nr:dephospho-CoA kinase [Clostridia bacterium]